MNEASPHRPRVDGGHDWKLHEAATHSLGQPPTDPASVEAMTESYRSSQTTRSASPAVAQNAKPGFLRSLMRELLDLARTGITDAGLRQLREIRTLDQLYVEGTQVTDAEIAELQHALPKLTIHR
jgi:hypothetical protein